MASPPEPSDEHLKRYAEAAAKYTSKQERDERALRFIMDRYEHDRSRTGMTIEGVETLHHFIGESLLCAIHAQDEYHKSPRTAKAVAMNQAREMANNGTSVLSGKSSPTWCSSCTCAAMMAFMEALPPRWRFFSGLTSHAKKIEPSQNPGPSSPNDTEGVLGKRDACLLCFLGPLVA